MTIAGREGTVLAVPETWQKSIFFPAAAFCVGRLFFLPETRYFL